MSGRTVKHFIIGLIAACIIPANAADIQNNGTPQSKTYADGPAIWKVSDEDTTIYFFGTVHILSKDTEWRTDDFNQVWNSADTIYFETDTSPEAQAGMQKLVMSRGMNETGTGLSSFFSEEEMIFISEEASGLGLPIENLEPFRPWFAGVTLSVMQIISAGGDPEAGVEIILGREARNSEKNLRFFETADEQIGFFADLPDSLGARMLVDGLKQSKEYPDFFSDLVEAWRNGRLPDLQRLLNDAMQASDPIIAETILYNRNAKWANTLENVLHNEEGTFLVAVGAGHLIGEKSLRDYLSEKGIEAERQ